MHRNNRNQDHQNRKRSGGLTLKSHRTAKEFRKASASPTNNQFPLDTQTVVYPLKITQMQSQKKNRRREGSNELWENEGLTNGSNSKRKQFSEDRRSSHSGVQKKLSFREQDGIKKKKTSYLGYYNRKSSLVEPESKREQNQRLSKLTNLWKHAFGFGF